MNVKSSITIDYKGNSYHIHVFCLSDSVQDCPRNCHGNGECVSGVCHCFPGYHGADCAKGNGEVCFQMHPNMWKPILLKLFFMKVIIIYIAIF